MAFKIKSLPGTFYGALTDFRFYRELVRRPLGEAFIYLALLILLPVLLLTGPEIYKINRVLTRFTDSLQGNLPPLRIDRGKVLMDGKDYFHYSMENEFSINHWELQLARQVATDPESIRAIRLRRSGDQLSPEDEARIALFDRGVNWIDENYPDREALLTTSEVEERLEDLSPEDEELRNLLSDSAHYFNFFFRVDLTTDSPEAPQGLLGIVLGRESYTFVNPWWPQVFSLSDNTSEVINHQMVVGWKNKIVWFSIPLIIISGLGFYYLLAILSVLGGSAVSGLTASLLKCTLPFRQVFAIAVYAITPAVVFSFLSSGFPMIGINLSLGQFLLIFLGVYGFYLVSAARSCCSPA